MELRPEGVLVAISGMRKREKKKGENWGEEKEVEEGKEAEEAKKAEEWKDEECNGEDDEEEENEYEEGKEEEKGEEEDEEENAEEEKEAKAENEGDKDETDLAPAVWGCWGCGCGWGCAGKYCCCSATIRSCAFSNSTVMILPWPLPLLSSWSLQWDPWRVRTARSAALWSSITTQPRQLWSSPIWVFT